MRRLDDDAAFNYYVALGPTRRHSQVAAKFEMSRRTVTKAARRGGWSARLQKIESDARAISDQAAAESMAQVRDRMLKMTRFIGVRGLQALQRFELEDAPSAIKAIETSIRLERMLLGEPSDTTGVTIEAITRREIDMYLEEGDVSDDDEAEED
jgi:hypothetical protein